MATHGTQTRTCHGNDEAKPFIPTIDLTQDYKGFVYLGNHFKHWTRIAEAYKK